MKLFFAGLGLSVFSYASIIEYKCVGRYPNRTYIIGNAVIDNIGNCVVSGGTAHGFLMGSAAVSTEEIVQLLNETNMTGVCISSDKVDHLMLTSHPTTDTTLQISIPNQLTNSKNLSGSVTLFEKDQFIHTGCDNPQIRIIYDENLENNEGASL